MHAPHCVVNRSPSLSPATRTGHTFKWMREVAPSNQLLALAPVFPHWCPGLPGRGCGRGGLQHDWKGAAMPFPGRRRSFLTLWKYQHLKRKFVFCLWTKCRSVLARVKWWKNVISEKLNCFHFSKIRHNNHFPLLGSPEAWADKAVTY